MLSGCKIIKRYQVGYCLGRGAIAQKNLSWEKVRFYACAFLLSHPQKGLILVDTGYGEALLDEVSKGLGLLYRFLLNVQYDPRESLVAQLIRDGIALKDLSYLVITHFHPDHIGALPEFSEVPWIYREETLQELQGLSQFQAARRGVFKSLIPSVPEGSIAIKESDFRGDFHGFSSCDVFGDASLSLVDLPGHALGQMGIVMEKTLLAADAMWSSDCLPNWIGLLVQEDPKAYLKTYQKLKDLSRDISIIPTHIMEKHE